MSEGRKIAVFMSFSGDGGVERMIINLLGELASRGHAVDLLLIKARGSHLAQIPDGIRVIRLDKATSLLALPALVRYLRRERPAALLAAKDRAGRVAVLARRLARVPTRVAIRLGMNLSESLKGKGRLRRAARYYPTRWLYPWADELITVSDGVARDIAAVSGIARARFRVIPNPTVTADIHRLAAEPVEEPWLAHKEQPVILAVGRLKPQKDFATLIEAFAELRRQRPCRLIILGEGDEREALESLSRRLGVADSIKLPGFRRNPYAYVAHADLFVLSSRYEGAPNVLVEALALGVPSVATDCRSGPAEILAGGCYGPLVPVGDAEALARAMLDTLDNPQEGSMLRAAVADYDARVSTDRYLDALLDGAPTSSPLSPIGGEG